ncbi:MAG: hypothetical protein WD063_12350 [Pirellulales bacterium]
MGKTADEKSSGGKKKWIIALVIFLLTVVGAWAFFPAGEDPALARIQDLRDQMENAPTEKRRELWGKMREEYRNLPEEAREQLSAQRRQRWEAREQKSLNDFFALTPAEQIAKMDEQLKEEEERRQRWAQRRAQGGDRQGRDPTRGRGDGGGGGDRGWGSGRGSRDSLERRKGYLDNTTPQARAQRSEFRRMREERRRQLGLPSRDRR